MGTVIDYATPGVFTRLDGVDSGALAGFAADPVGMCLPVHELVIQPRDAQALNLPADRFADNQLRPVEALVRRLLALDPAPLTVAREAGKRVVGTCRHFAVLSCALLRHHGIAARVRCGFATYFSRTRRSTTGSPNTATVPAGSASTPRSSAPRCCRIHTSCGPGIS